MPEGHILHRLARDLRPLIGHPVRASSPQGRFADGAAALDGRVLEGVEAYGKHLLLDFGDTTLHVHLGRVGSMFVTDPARAPRAGVRLRLAVEGPPAAWDLVAPIRCELIGPVERAALAARLGPDPLRGDDPQASFERIRASDRPVGELLLDQSVLAGAGNVLRAEVLHLCGLHPARRGSSLAEDDLHCLWDTLTDLMRRAVEAGRIVSVPATLPAAGAPLPDENEGRYVYKQQRCRDCGGEVRSWTLGGRTAWACETCQPAA